MANPRLRFQNRPSRAPISPLEQPCKCQGSNENCSRCAGRGSYIPLAARTGSPCTWCGLAFSDDMLHDHMSHCAIRLANSVPFDSLPGAFRRPPARSSPRKVPPPRLPVPPGAPVRAKAWLCPKCSALIQPASGSAELAKKRLAEHTCQPLRQPASDRVIPAGQASLRVAVPLADAQTQLNQMTLCSVCRVPVKLCHLARHMRKVHLGEPVSRAPLPRRAPVTLPPIVGAGSFTRPRPLATGVQSRAAHLGSERIIPANEADERRLDGSSGYWPVRDQGRFNSHPSFDRMDDESLP